MIVKEFSKSIKTFLKKETAANTDPKVDFVNCLDKYKIKLLVAENLMDKIQTEVKPASLSISIDTLKKKIYFSQPVDVNNITSYYDNGVYHLELPKLPETPVDRLNRMALMLGV